jgi:hypothetical protein
LKIFIPLLKNTHKIIGKNELTRDFLEKGCTFAAQNRNWNFQNLKSLIIVINIMPNLKEIDT